jgi:hypothetical protein
MIRGLAAGTLVLVASCGEPQPGVNPELEAQALRAIAAAEEVQQFAAKYGESGPRLLDGTQAPRDFQGRSVTCGHGAEPLRHTGQRPRMLVFGGTIATREGLIGADDAWFDYVWRRAGCDQAP